MIKNIRILMLNDIQKFYRFMVSYCHRMAVKCVDKKEYHKADLWRSRMTRYFSKQCDIALKIIELAS